MSCHVMMNNRIILANSPGISCQFHSSVSPLFQGTMAAVPVKQVGSTSGGTAVAAISEYPYVVYVASTFPDGTTMECTGVILTDSYVLTSAQCVNK